MTSRSQTELGHSLANVGDDGLAHRVGSDHLVSSLLVAAHGSFNMLAGLREVPEGRLKGFVKLLKNAESMVHFLERPAPRVVHISRVCFGGQVASSESGLSFVQHFIVR
jgi:hypothetical protein